MPCVKVKLVRLSVSNGIHCIYLYIRRICIFCRQTIRAKEKRYVGFDIKYMYMLLSDMSVQCQFAMLTRVFPGFEGITPTTLLLLFNPKHLLRKSPMTIVPSGTITIEMAIAPMMIDDLRASSALVLVRVYADVFLVSTVRVLRYSSASSAASSRLIFFVCVCMAWVTVVISVAVTITLEMTWLTAHVGVM